MQCVIYVRDGLKMSPYEQWNVCCEYAKRFGYSIKGKVFDFDGTKFYEAVDKVAFQDDVDCVIVYHAKYVGDFEDYLFYKIYLDNFGKKLIPCT